MTTTKQGRGKTRATQTTDEKTDQTIDKDKQVDEKKEVTTEASGAQVTTDTGSKGKSSVDDKSSESEEGDAETTVEVENGQVDRFASIVTDDMTDAGKAFYQESEHNATTCDVQIVVVGSSELSIGIYTAAAIKAAYFAELPNGDLIANRLSDFITKSFGFTNEDRDYALNMFQMLIRSTENLDAATFTKTYQKLTEFVGNDIRAGGFFTDTNAISALRGSPEASSFFSLLKRLVPSKDRKALAAKTNYAQACGLFRKEQSRELLASLFK